MRSRAAKSACMSGAGTSKVRPDSGPGWGLCAGGGPSRGKSTNTSTPARSSSFKIRLDDGGSLVAEGG